MHWAASPPRVNFAADRPAARLPRLEFATSAIVLSAWLIAAPAVAENPGSGSQRWAIHGQTTFLTQGVGAFHSPYSGSNSLTPHQVKETFDATLYAGFRPWAGAELWINPEIDQGFGLSNTLGAAGFPSGEAYKVGKSDPYAKLPRWFLRQTIKLGGNGEKVESDLNQIAGRQTANRLVVTLGKFSVVDLFDTNDQAHDPRTDFMNWTVIDAGTFDYAANAWGYTYGAAAELYEGQWTARGGFFALSDVPNSAKLDSSFDQYELDGEIEHRHSISGWPGRLKFTVFVNHGRMGRFNDAIRLAETNGQPADIGAVRAIRNRTGVSFNLEQQVSNAVSFFVKSGLANGAIEPYEFTDVDRTISGGVTVKGRAWGRPDDRIGVAGVVNAISQVHKRFLDAGGLGILVGDGRLPHPGPEEIIEAYYDCQALKGVYLSGDYQFIANPGYNRDRGPASVLGMRLHGEF